MRISLEITFGPSPSIHYRQAVEQAQTFARYRQAGPTRIHTITVTASLAHEAIWRKIQRLLRLVHGWRTTRMTVAGHPVNYWQLTHRLDQVRGCYARKVQ